MGRCSTQIDESYELARKHARHTHRERERETVYVDVGSGKGGVEARSAAKVDLELILLGFAEGLLLRRFRLRASVIGGGGRLLRIVRRRRYCGVFRLRLPRLLLFRRRCRRAAVRR